jgi:hypothetical protein
VVVLLLPHSLAMDNSEFYNVGGSCGRGGGLAAAVGAAAVTAAAVDDDWWGKLLATRALTVARCCAMTKIGSRQQHNNQPTMGEAKGRRQLVSRPPQGKVVYNWHQKRPTKRVLTVARRRAMTKVGNRQQRNNQPTVYTHHSVLHCTAVCHAEQIYCVLWQNKPFFC